jgi:hypothetical protein
MPGSIIILNIVKKKRILFILNFELINYFLNFEFFPKYRFPVGWVISTYLHKGKKMLLFNNNKKVIIMCV